MFGTPSPIWLGGRFMRTTVFGDHKKPKKRSRRAQGGETVKTASRELGTLPSRYRVFQLQRKLSRVIAANVQALILISINLPFLNLLQLISLTLR
jgi:hypothetical protein